MLERTSDDGGRATIPAAPTTTLRSQDRRAGILSLSRAAAIPTLQAYQSILRAAGYIRRTDERAATTGQ